MKSVGVVVLTLNAEKHLVRCLSPIMQSSLSPKILVVDSSSSDQTRSLAYSLGVEVLSIPQATFNHGKTRELARKHLGTDLVVMLTPDAYAVNPQVLEKLVEPIIQGKASIAYARQIPHEGADFFESFPRYYNYPVQSEIRSIADRRRYGSYTFFCSDSCAAYLNSALDEVKGFRSVLLGEDTLATAQLLKIGHKIAYVAEAEVRHSHRYSLRQEFCRYFDTGLMRKKYENILNCAEDDQLRGNHYATCMLKQLYQEKPLLLPYALMHIGAKWAGYRLGQASINAPLWWKKALSSQKYYWKKITTS
jgi:rhamnosyltransferase